MTLTSTLRSVSSRIKNRTPETVHIAIIAPDLATAKKVRKLAAMLPTSWPGQAKIHVIIEDPDLDNQLRVTLANLQMVHHADLNLIYPVDLELGWAEEP